MKSMKLAVIVIFAVLLAITFFGCNIGSNPGNRHIHAWTWAASTAWGMETGTCSDCTETRLRYEPDMMEQIPAGTNITMTNYSNASDTYTVSLSAFKIGKYQVTQAQYELATGDRPSSFTTEAATGEVQENRPVENVTWYDAIEFCNKLSVREGLTAVYTITGRTPVSGYPITGATVTADFNNNGYRLPTEAQWEYACRAGSTGAYSKDILGNEVESSNLGEYAWYSANSDNKTHQVGKRTANARRLYDMHGNVWEWCWDRNGAYPNESKTDYAGSASGSARMIRGGSWNYSAEFAVSSSRYFNDPNTRNNNLGFRLARP